MTFLDFGVVEFVLMVAAIALAPSNTSENMTARKRPACGPLKILLTYISLSPEFIHRIDAKQGPPVAKLAVLPTIYRYYET